MPRITLTPYIKLEEFLEECDATKELKILRLDIFNKFLGGMTTTSSLEARVFCWVKVAQTSELKRCGPKCEREQEDGGLIFKDLRDLGLFNGDYLHKQCLKFCFLPIIRKELRLVATSWNTHNIQRQRRCEVEVGKPDVMFFLPKVYGSNYYLSHVNMQDCKEICGENCPDDNDDMDELIRLLKPDYVPPSNEYEALDLYACRDNKYIRKRIKSNYNLIFCQI